MAVRDLKPKQIWEALHPEDKQVCQVGTPVSKHGHAQEKGFVAATAAATGQTERTTYRAIARADALGDEALAKVVPDSPTLDCNTSLVQLCQPRKQIWEALHPEARIVLEVAQAAPLQVAAHGGAPTNTRLRRRHGAGYELPSTERVHAEH